MAAIKEIVTMRGPQFPDEAQSRIEPLHRELRASDFPGAYPPGTRIGTFELLRELGKGAMGQVHLAMDHALGGRLVAVKLMVPCSPSVPPEGRTRFQREVNNLARLQHPRIVRILAAGEHEGHPYFVMDYIDGRDFTAYMTECSGLAEEMRLRKLIKVVVEVSEAIEYAHRQHIVHRDLKPSNIIVTLSHDEAMVFDFGIAKSLDDTSLTHPGPSPGTPMFQAPEQFNPRLKTEEHLIDIWALGVILYRACTGKFPFQGADYAEQYHLVLRTVPRRPRALNPVLPPPLANLIMTCLDKQPDKRPKRAGIVAAMLERVLKSASFGLPSTIKPVREAAVSKASFSSLGPSEPAPPPGETPRPRPRLKSRVVIGLCLGMAAMGAVAAWTFGLRSGRGLDPTDAPGSFRESILLLSGAARFQDYYVPTASLEADLVPVPLETTCEIDELELTSSSRGTAQSLPVRVASSSPIALASLPSHLLAEDGEYSLFIRGRCPSGEEFSGTKRLFVRRKPLAVKDLKPGLNAVLPRASGTVTGILPEPAASRLYFGDVEIAADADGRFSAPFSLPSKESCRPADPLRGGIVLSTLRLVDRFGNANDLTPFYFVHEEPPRLRITSINGAPIRARASAGSPARVLAGRPLVIEYVLDDGCKNASISFEIRSQDSESHLLLQESPGKATTGNVVLRPGTWRLVAGLAHPGHDSVEMMLAVESVPLSAVPDEPVRIFNACEEISISRDDLSTRELRWSSPAYIRIKTELQSLAFTSDVDLGPGVFRFQDAWYIRLGDRRRFGVTENMKLDFASLEAQMTLTWQRETTRQCPVCGGDAAVDCPRCEGKGTMPGVGKNRVPCDSCEATSKTQCRSCLGGFQAVRPDDELLRETLLLDSAHEVFARAASARTACEAAKSGADQALAPSELRLRSLPKGLSAYNAAVDDYWSAREALHLGSHAQAVEKLASSKQSFLQFTESSLDEANAEFTHIFGELRSSLEEEMDNLRAIRRDELVGSLARQIAEDSGGSVKLIAAAPGPGRRTAALAFELSPACLDSNGLINSSTLSRIARAARHIFASSCGENGAMAQLGLRFPNGVTVPLFRESLLVLERAKQPEALLKPQRSKVVSSP